jgi:thiamine-phosphate pyrophosphorylase
MLRPQLDLSIYLVTDRVTCGEYGVAATVSAAVDGGVSLVQLRDEDATDEEFVNLGCEIMAVLWGTDVALIINNRVHLVAAIGAHGAHVGQTDLGIAESRELLGPEPYLGLSVQTLAHVTAAREHGGATLDYLGVGPVWRTTTKIDAAVPTGLGRLQRITSVSPWPCVAIGGINIDRLTQVRRAGAAGVAVVSAICGRPDVTTAVQTLRAVWDGTSK